MPLCDGPHDATVDESDGSSTNTPTTNTPTTTLMAGAVRPSISCIRRGTDGE